jgi:hypothetical protein
LNRKLRLKFARQCDDCQPDDDTSDSFHISRFYVPAHSLNAEGVITHAPTQALVCLLRTLSARPVVGVLQQS